MVYDEKLMQIRTVIGGLTFLHVKQRGMYTYSLTIHAVVMKVEKKKKE